MTAVLVVILSSFMVPFMMAALNVALPAIGEAFALDAVGLGWVVTSYSLATAVLLLPSGRIGDLWGRKPVFVWGLVVYAAGALLAAGAGSGAALLAGRIVNGIGAGMNFATGMAILVTAVPPHDRGRVIGWNVAAVYLGLSVGPVLGGVIAHDLGWRWIFGLGGATALAAAAVAGWKLEASAPAPAGARFDLSGSCLYGLALVALILGCARLPGPAGVLLLAASLAGFAAFVAWERRTADPVFDMALITTNRMFAFSNLAALVHYSATSGVGFLISLYLQYAKGLPARHAGLVLMTQPIVMALFSPLAGRWSDRLGSGRLASIGMGLAVVSLALFCLLGQHTPMAVTIAGLVLLGFGFALFSSPNTHAVMGCVPPRHYGAASGVLGTMRVVGQVLSMAVVMLIMTVVLGHVPIGPSNLAGFLHCQRLAFGIFAVLCLAGVFASLVRGTPAHPPPDRG